jgi:predicted nucleic acid-binding protein
LDLKRLRAFLHRHKRIALDTSVFIYQLEANPRYVDLTDHVFASLEREGYTAVTSTITMTELLVRPYRDSNDQQVNEFYALLTTFPNLEWVPPDLRIADVAARIRAGHRLRTPDALQAATAIQMQATGFITNDPIFDRMSAFETLVLEPLLSEQRRRAHK